MILKTVRDIDSDKIQMSREINHGDFTFRYVVKLEYTEEWGDDAVATLGRYHVSLLVVSPEEARKTDSFESALRCCGYTEEQIKGYGKYAAYEVLTDYGSYALIGQWNGNNLRSLMKSMRKELGECEMIFGFKMDRPNNTIGTTGWDAVRGDTLRPLREFHTV